jgi:hypothetical protein
MDDGNALPMARRNRLTRRQAGLFLTAVLLAAAASEGALGEYEVKAAFLYNFGKFVEWPRDSSQAREPVFVIGVLGTDPFGGVLDRISRGGIIHGKPVTIRRFNTRRDLNQCHVLFISRSETSSLPEILNTLGKDPVLTVGDSEGFVRSGGAIGLFLEGNKVRFAINLKATERAGLTVSSKLLRLASSVQK